MKPSNRRPLRFTSVEIENWRNFRRAEVPLPRRVFLIGPNASGKSNFLDIFRFLQDISLAGGGFQHAVSKRGGVSALRCLAARRYPDIRVVVRIGDDDDPAIWEYELRFKQDNLRRPIIAKERVTFQGQELLSRPDKEDQSDPARLTQTYLEQVNVNKEFRQISDFVASVRYLHVVPQLIREPDRSVGHRNDPFGGDFLEQIAGKPQKTREAWLRRIGDAMKVAVPQLQELALFRDARGTPHLRGTYEHWRPRGAWQTEDQFSDGTLRLMGLLWALLEGSGPLLLEEPELSLHPDVVRYIPQMFARVQRKAGRQAIVSTHSTELLADPSIGLDEVLLLVPGTEGTEVHPAKNTADIQVLIEEGVSLAEALIPLTRPKGIQQLALFG
jgi:predicted ATPase